MSRTLQLSTGEFFTPSLQPCETFPTAPLEVRLEGLGTYIIYWVNCEYPDDALTVDCSGIFVQNPSCNKYYIHRNAAKCYGEVFDEDPEYTYEELKKLCAINAQWIISISIYDHSSIAIFPTEKATPDKWDTTSNVALWYPSARVRLHIIHNLIPIFRLLEIHVAFKKISYEIVHKDTGIRVVPYKFPSEVHAFNYVFSHFETFASLLPNLKDQILPETEYDLTDEDWAIARYCAKILCRCDCEVYTASCGYVEAHMDFVDTNGHVHEEELPYCIYVYDCVYREWNNQTLKNIFLDYAVPEINKKLQTYRKFVCPKCGTHRLYTKYRLPSYMVCNATVSIQQLSDPKSDSPETYIGAGYPRLGPSVPDAAELEAASCSQCGHDVTEEVRELLGKEEWPEESEIFQKYDIPENWQALLDEKYPPEMW